MIKSVDGVNNNVYRINESSAIEAQTSVKHPVKNDEFVLQKPQASLHNNSFLNKLKSVFAALAIGLATQSCSDDYTVKDIENTQSGQVLDFGDALDKLKDDSYTLTVPEIIEKLDSTVYANKDKINDFAKKSDENYETTNNFVNTVLSAFGSKNSENSALNEEFKDIAEENDGLLNQDYVNKINGLYEKIHDIQTQNPGFFDTNAYLADISNKQDDLKTNCKVANTVRHKAIMKLGVDAEDFHEKEPVLNSDEYNNTYDKYMQQISELSDMESLNTKEADEKINELINTYNELNNIADSNGKDKIYDAGLKMLNASHTMVDAACTRLIDAMEDATSNTTPDFSASFGLIHYNLDKIMNTNDYDSPVVDEIINGLNL